MSNHVPHPNHDRGLEFDLSTLMSRRSLGMFFGAGGAAAALAACTPGGSGSTASTPSSAATESAAASRRSKHDGDSHRQPHAHPGDRRVRCGDPRGNGGPLPR